jgi:putative chitinase
MISLLAVQATCNSKDPAIELIYPFLCDTMTKYGIDTPLREAMFIAQGAHESAGFRIMEEVASGEAYEGRKDLGNVNAGDGVKYKGRGVFDLTGAKNYARFSAVFFGNDLLLTYPERVSEPELAAQSAGWFWNQKGLNKAADEGDMITSTLRINGVATAGPPCWLDRRVALYNRALYALGVQG